MTGLKDTLDQIWPGVMPSGLPSPGEGLGAAPGFRPPPTPAEAKAEQTTRTAREMIEADAEERQARTARLRQARLEKEAAERAAAPEAPTRRR